MLSPKRQKYRKAFRGKNRGVATRGFKIDFGEYGLKALQHAQVSSVQLEAARKAVAHYTKREGKIWIRAFPDKPVTSKASGSGMGAGKGEIKGYVAVVKPGKIIIELAGVSREIALESLKRAASKLPLKTRFLNKEI